MRSALGRLRRLPRRLPRGALPLAALTAAGVAAVAIIGALLLLHLRNVGVEHERRAAERQTQCAPLAVGAPYLTPAVLRGEPKALARLDHAMRTQVLHDPIRRVKLW